MTHQQHQTAEKLIGAKYEDMDARTKKVARHLTARTHISKNTSAEQAQNKTFGQNAADAVAKFGGSWAFIGLFALVLFAWVLLNSYILVNYNKAFDPYPYILLNLFLSMLASVQAPLILMSQNRQAEIDRQNAEHDYEVNLKAELEIMLLHEKVDLLRENQWSDLLEIQKQQLTLLTDLIAKK
jgi:uncharacterized membrane protein